MYPIPPGEHLVENRTCKHCATVFPITDKDMEFYAKVSPVFHTPSSWTKWNAVKDPEVPGFFAHSEWRVQVEWEKVRYLIPPPTLCPDCRQQRRLSFRNERKLYKRTCDATGKEIISIYSPDKPYTVYHQDYWWSDAWDPIDYGREFDFSRSAFEQFWELMKEVPRISLLNGYSDNSEYCNHAWKQKDCYMSHAAWENEKCVNSTFLRYCAHCIDSSNMQRCSHMYESIDSEDCTNSINLVDCVNVSDSLYLFGCYNCHHCIWCVDIQNQSYMVLNKKVQKEEWDKIYNQIKDDSQFREKVLIEIQKLEHKIPKKYLHGVHHTNSTWDYIYNTENVLSSYNTTDSKNIRYSIYAWSCSDNMDCSLVWGNWNWAGDELNYESHTCLGYNNCFSNLMWWGHHNLYCDYFLGNSDNCFLCTWLRNASYCILNKQYTKEQYERLVPQIIEKMMSDGEWWEFFPASMSPFGYNETVAQEYFPLEKEEALRNGIFNWSDYEAPFPRVEKIIPASKLPDSIESIPDDILNWAIECEVTKKPFRIIRQELEFYRKHSLPIPRRHPDVRHMDRMKMRNPRKLYERLCDCERCESNHNTSPLSFSVGESVSVVDTSGTDALRAWQKDGSVILSDSSFGMNPKTGTRTKRIITTYAPERPETVYCDVCYEREVLS